jgi:hypothetical protein
MPFSAVEPEPRARAMAPVGVLGDLANATRDRRLLLPLRGRQLMGSGLEENLAAEAVASRAERCEAAEPAALAADLAKGVVAMARGMA